MLRFWVMLQGEGGEMGAMCPNMIELVICADL